ncbi:MAG: outer membrane receptor protein involved in Fe transport [Marivirga sp.]|jgi:outer membrane receptor protein involved in Fe transport
MNKTKRTFSLIAIIIMVSFQTVYGQKIEITGQILNDITGEAMSFTNVSLFNDSNELITGAVTSEDGQFKLQASAGSYNLNIQFVSFKTIVLSIVLEGDRVALGKIGMKEDIDQMSEVVVVAKKPQMEMKLDKRVFNVGQDLSNIGGNAESILDNLPSVTVDVDGGVSLRGSGNVRILINGRPSGLVGIDGSSALKQIPADLIESIEVITNPSARYEAEGNAGIINIILKKDTKAGINGSFSANLGYPTILGGSANLNYRKNAFNFFGSYGFRYDENFGGGYRDQRFLDDNGKTSSYLYNSIDRSRSDISNNFRFGMDYNITDKTVITGSFLYRISDQDNITENAIDRFNLNRELTASEQRTQNELEAESVVEYSVNLAKTFGENKDHKLTADIQYRNNNEKEDSEITTDFLNADLGSYEKGLFQTSLVDEFSENLLLQANYVKPVGETSSFEAGWRTTMRTITNNYIVQEEQEDGSFSSLEAFTNDFQYEENIHAFYAIYNNQWDKVSVQLGLRSEYTDIRTKFGERDTLEAREPYMNLFPSAFLTYKLNNVTDVQASYSRRFDRPSFRSLNPFSNFGDNTNIRIGNPNLIPEFTDSYEVGIMNNFKSASLYSGIYYRHTEGLIERVNTIIDSVIYRQPQNIGVRNSIGLENTYSHDLNDWWTLNANMNIFYSVTDGKLIDGEGKLIDLYAETFTLSSRLTSQMTFWKDLTFQLSGFYRAPEREPQSYRKSFYMIDLGLSKEVLNKKGTISLSVRDLLNSRKWRTNTVGDGFEYDSEFQWRTRTFRLTLDYRINNQKKNTGRDNNNEGGGGGEDY